LKDWLEISVPKQIRIMHLITGLNTGGAEIALSRLVEVLDRDEFDSHVISMVPTGLVGEHIRALGFPVASLEMPPGRPTLDGFLKLIRLLRDFRPNILQTWLYHADLLGLFAGKLSGVPAIAWNIRGSELNIMNSPRLSGLVLKICATLSGFPQIVVVNSNAGLISHKNLGYHPRKWQLIPNGIDTNKFKPDIAAGRKIRAEWGFSDEIRLVGIVARVDPQKGYEYFFRAAQIVKEKYSNARFVCIGTGPVEYIAELKTLAKTLDLDQYVMWAGVRSDMPAVYNSFDMVVSSSAYGEGFPNVVAETMSCGIPCIATKTGDSATLVDHAGVIIPARDYLAMSEAILLVLGQSDEERKNMGEKSRQRIIEYYSLGKMTSAYADLYRQLALC
jgi:glycosyltransferase involved in cell wall biosynthesis